MKKDLQQNLCDEASFNGFYTSYITNAKNFAYYKCGDSDNALDLAQEAFIKIWENCGKIDFTKAKTYLFTTINNLFLNKVKHQKVVLNYKNEYQGPDKTNLSPEFVLEEKEFKTKLQNAIADLTDGQREVFLLNRIDGMKYREIAEMLDISVKAVEKRMSGALKILKEKIPTL